MMEFPNYPLTKEQTEEITKIYPTPFHIYFEEGIVKNAQRLKSAFSWNKGFKEFFAVKACPNPHILALLKKQGFGTDCSSIPELVMSEKVGVTGEEIMFSSNDTPAEEFVKANELGAIINLDDISHIEFLESTLGEMPKLISFRYNPGPMRQTGTENVIGNPEDAKYGFTKEQLFEGYKMCKEKGVKRFGIHTMIVSNELAIENLVLTAQMLFELAVELKEKLGIELEFANVGGGIGVAYKPQQEPVNLENLSAKIKEQFDSILVPKGLGELKLYMENGRFITGPYGFLVSRVRHIKHTYKDYVGLDACMANLMRPALYGSYHHETVLGKENAPRDYKYDVTGSLCENNDKFAIDRMLPEINVGDLIAIHDAGAHGYAMGFNYNGKLRSAELLYKPDGTVKKIRRAETIDAYFATLNFDEVE